MNRTIGTCTLAAAALVSRAPVRAAAPVPSSAAAGIVVAADGNPVGGARVTASTSAASARTSTRPDGFFRVAVAGTPPVRLRIDAPGYAAAQQTLEAAESSGLRIALSSAALAEEVTVTASRTPRTLAETAAPTTVLPREDLRSAAAPVIDDVLRRVPGFSLFRRTGSRTANPTSQGVSLRGLGASGTSRALVLADDVPVNDPFGGWVYWGRVPEIALDRAEVVEGGASDLWGSAALGGVVRLVRRDDATPGVDAETWGGSESSGDGALRIAGAAGPVRLSADGELFATGGYVPVAPEDRGPVDVRAGSRHRTLEGTASTIVGESSLFVRGSRYLEERGNGTLLQRNDTQITEWSGGFDGAAVGGALGLRAYRSDEIFHQSFSAIAPDRTSETLTSRQRVPSSATGGSAQWSRALGTIHELSAGADFRRVEGTSEDTAYLPSGPSLRPSGGTQDAAAGWIEDVASLSPALTVSGSLRYDAWRNSSGRTFAAGAPIALPDRSADSWSPRLSAVWAATRTVSLTASAYRAFRAPTLNELYRPFRLGNVQTLANADLSPETVTGAETGVRWQTGDGRVFARAALFWMDLHDAVGNVTLSTTPSLITRQRENIGRIRDRGAELAVDARLSPEWTAAAGYLLADSRVVAAPRNPSLVGNRVPQVPRDQATMEIRFSRPSLATIAVQGRWSGPQFDDDANAFPLGSFFTLDALVSKALPAGFEVFGAVENATNRRNEAGRTPVVTLAPPRIFRAGIRWRV
ncbi:MAG TPA: TonB-dependent receptor [Thermoanaerobaculia bacterium]|nr:TonB-dependent receptor [Thermoanaerobaculia bacterium]